MLHCHDTGTVECGIYPHAEAVRLASDVEQFARNNNFPLQVVVENAGGKLMSLPEGTPTIRSWIVASIRRILAGGPFKWADWEAQPLEGWQEVEPKPRFMVRSSEYPAHAAWMRLQWWVNDDDIRLKDAEYADMKKAGAARPPGTDRAGKPGPSAHMTQHDLEWWPTQLQ